MSGSSIGIAGTGRVARVFGRLLAGHGEPVVAIAGRTHARSADAAAWIGGAVEAVTFRELPARASRILIAVTDDAIPSVAMQLAGAGMTNGVVLHTCGVHGSEILEPLAEAGVSCGALHPLQTIAGAEQGIEALPGSFFAVAGDAEAARWGAGICELLGGKLLSVAPGCMPLYHSAAVMASNYVTGLLDAAVILMKRAGIDGERALEALGPLVRASVANTLEKGAADALTGPIERGDVETVRRHLLSLADGPQSAEALYRAAGLHVVELARRRGLDENRARAIEALLREGT